MEEEIAPYLTPSQYFAAHEITQKVRALGFTNEQLEGLRFRDSNSGLPFNSWRVSFPANPEYELRPDVRICCALHYAVVENPPWSRDKEDAWLLLGEAIIANLLEIGLKHRQAQSRKGQAPRKKITKDGQTINQFVVTLALKPQYRGLAAKELWNQFLGDLGAKNLEPHEQQDPRNPEGLICEYRDLNDKLRWMSFRTFSNIVSQVHRGKKSRLRG